MSAAPKSVLVIGANRGIGLNLVRKLAERGWKVTGSIRPETRQDPSVLELQKTGASVIEIDFLKEDTIIAAAKSWGPEPLDMLINSAGVGPEPFVWSDHTAETLLEKFQVNTIGPFLTTKHFYPHLKRSVLGKVINISSRGASLDRTNSGSNNDGLNLGYRMAKTALNQQTVTLAKEFEFAGENIAVLSIYPGYLPTRLSSFRSRNDMEECITGVVDVAEALTLKNTGSFLNWKGETMLW